MTLSSSTFNKPEKVQTLAVLTLISGIINILAGLGITAAMLVSVVLICIAPFGVLPIILGVFEIIYATKLLANPPQPVRPSQTIAVLEIVCILFGNIIAVIVGVLALVFYSDAAVKAYFAALGGQPAPEPPVAPPVEPALPVLPVVSEPAIVPPVEPAPPVLPTVTEPEQPAPAMPVVEPTRIAQKPAKPKPAAKKPAKPAGAAPKAKSTKPAQATKPKTSRAKPAAKPATPKTRKPTG